MRLSSRTRTTKQVWLRNALDHYDGLLTTELDEMNSAHEKQADGDPFVQVFTAQAERPPNLEDIEPNSLRPLERALLVTDGTVTRSGKPELYDDHWSWPRWAQLAVKIRASRRKRPRIGL